MTDTSGEIKLQSNKDIICHIAKVKPATSEHYVADLIPFLAYIIFPWIQRSNKAKIMYFTHNNEFSCFSSTTVTTQCTFQSIPWWFIHNCRHHITWSTQTMLLRHRSSLWWLNGKKSPAHLPSGFLSASSPCWFTDDYRHAINWSICSTTDNHYTGTA